MIIDSRIHRHPDRPRRRRRCARWALGFLGACGLAGLTACADSTAAPGGAAIPTLTLTPVISGLSDPVYLTAPSGDPRLFVVEQSGRIVIYKNGALLDSAFLNITAKIKSGGEQGLLSMAFHPHFATNGYFYVNYTDLAGDTQVERYTVSADPDIATVATAKPILHVTQPFDNHNGGLVMFGEDGMLYIGMGDGGSSGDPNGNGQDKSTLLGDLLRIDVDAGDPYAIPPSNPFVGTSGARGEIWAAGLRNPWRFAFDRVAHHLYIADVGQNTYEEVDIAPAATGGQNYGWNIMEGMHCYPPPSGGCSQAGLTLPVLEYTHDDGCAITGGFVYRGAAIPQLAGTYFYADYCEGWIRSFKYSAGSVTARTQWDLPNVGSILSFGQDAAGELYVLSANGTAYRLATAP